MKRKWSSGLLASVAILVALGSCRAETSAPPAADDRAGGGLSLQTAAETVAALCEVRRDVSSDVSAAEATFEDRAHSTLHLLAVLDSAQMMQVTRKTIVESLDEEQRQERDRFRALGENTADSREETDGVA